MRIWIIRVIESTRITRQSGIDMVKQSTISTGNLKRFLALQLRPINRVVYAGSSWTSHMESSS